MHLAKRNFKQLFHFPGDIIMQQLAHDVAVDLEGSITAAPAGRMGKQP